MVRSKPCSWRPPAWGRRSNGSCPALRCSMLSETLRSGPSLPRGSSAPAIPSGHKASTIWSRLPTASGSADPEAVGRRDQIVEALWPLGIAGADDPRGKLGPDLKVSLNIEHLKAGQEPFDLLPHAGGRHEQGFDRTMRADQTVRHRVARLSDPTPRRSGKPVLGQQTAAQRHTHAATADWARRVRASPTSSRLGVPPPARSVTVHASFRTLS